MTTETTLTNEEIRKIWLETAKIIPHCDHHLYFAHAIEQAVLQSEQVQAWKRYAERYNWLRTQCEKPIGGLTICEVGLFGLKPWSGNVPGHCIDAAMEREND